MRAGLIAFVGALTSLGAAAEDFCAALDVPAVLELECRTLADGGTVVQGDDTPLAALNQLRLRRLAAPVEDPEAWLREQMTVDTSGLAQSLKSWVQHPDNPIKPEALQPSLDALLGALRGVETLALTGCEAPLERAPGRWSMRCRYDATVAEGVVYQELRLTDGLPVAIDFRAASAQRVRQFEALLNGLRLE